MDFAAGQGAKNDIEDLESTAVALHESLALGTAAEIGGPHILLLSAAYMMIIIWFIMVYDIMV